MISEKFPLSVSWYTTFAGNDYRENRKRAVSYTHLTLIQVLILTQRTEEEEKYRKILSE